MKVKSLKKWVKKGVAFGAACAFAATSLPVTGWTVLAADTKGAKEDGLVLHYDFSSLKTGTIVEDLSGNGKAGVYPSNRFPGNDRGCKYLWYRSDCV